MAVQQNRKQRVLFQLYEWTVETVITYIGDVQVYIVSGFQGQAEKAVGVAGCSLMAFSIIDGGAYKGLWGGFVSYEAADYNVFCFSWGWCICLIVYILRTVFETECANSGITAGRLLLYLSVTDVLLKRIHTKRLHLSAGWFLLKLYGWGFVSYLMLREAHHVLFLCLNANVHEAKEQKKRKFRMELHHWVMSSFVSSVWFMISIMSSIGVLSKVVVK